MTKRPVLIKIGKHLIAPDDVIGFREARAGLYIMRLKSDPQPEYPSWITERELEKAKKYFDIIGG